MLRQQLARPPYAPALDVRPVFRPPPRGHWVKPGFPRKTPQKLMDLQDFSRHIHILNIQPVCRSFRVLRGLIAPMPYTGLQQVIPFAAPFSLTGARVWRGVSDVWIIPDLPLVTLQSLQEGRVSRWCWGEGVLSGLPDGGQDITRYGNDAREHGPHRWNSTFQTAHSCGRWCRCEQGNASRRYAS
jgi:hypothetical protein